MHRDGPVTQLPIGAAPGKWPGLRVCLMLLLGAGLLCVPVLAAPAPGDKPAAAQVKDTTPANYVGSEVCATCHDEVSKNFADNPHTKIALLHGKNHGAGACRAWTHRPAESRATKIRAGSLVAEVATVTDATRFSRARRKISLTRSGVAVAPMFGGHIDVDQADSRLTVVATEPAHVPGLSLSDLRSVGLQEQSCRHELEIAQGQVLPPIRG